MTLWYLEPRDPLVIRDGRPNVGRSESSTLAFPYPSTIAGLVRTRLGSDASGSFALKPSQLDELRASSVRGPVLVRPSSNEFLVPAPRDCLWTESSSGATQCRNLHPIALPEGTMLDREHSLGAVGLDSEECLDGKPPREPIRFWPWPAMEKWLSSPGNVDFDKLRKDGVGLLPTETRIHVAIGEEGTARDGMLFSTTGLRFSENTSESKQLALAVDIEDCSVNGHRLTIEPGIAPAGGERRLCRWTSASAARLPSVSQAVLAHVASTEPTVRVRVIMLTPAVFDAGWCPGSQDKQLGASSLGVDVKLVAACVPRPETISGWDFALRGPKATRRMVASGSVYWLDLSGEPAAREAWLRKVWMSNVSDKKQDCLDGFGLAIVGVAS